MIKLNLLLLEEKLKDFNKKIFTPQDLVVMFGASSRAVNGFLTYNSKRNRVIKLKNGLYRLKTAYPSLFLVANNVYRPSYVSFDTALSYYQIIPEVVYSMISATSRASRRFEINEVDYEYRSIKKEAFTGYVVKNVESEQILMALPEKALADYCYFFYLGKFKEWNDRMDLRNINMDLFKRYLDMLLGSKLTRYLKKYFKDL